MTDFVGVYAIFEEEPTIDRLKTLINFLEMMSSSVAASEMKENVLMVLKNLSTSKRFQSIRKDDAVLRLYKLLAKYSQNLGAIGVYESMNKKRMFADSLNFYLLWAEECAKLGNLQGFQEIHENAISRLSSKMSLVTIEAGFRDLADVYFKNSSHIFKAPDFLNRNGIEKKKRRSSVNVLKNMCPSVKVSNDYFGPKAKTVLKKEFLDYTDYVGISFEEFRAAMLRDDNCEDIEMDLEATIFNAAHEGDEEENISKLKPLKPINLRRKLAVVDEECNKEDDTGKKPRVYSPASSNKNTENVPLRNSTNETLNVRNDIDESRRTRCSSYKSDGVDLTTEDKYLEARAMFSDTLRLSNKTLAIEDDKTLQIAEPTETDTPPIVNADYSVFCDPLSFAEPVVSTKKKSTGTGLNVIYDEAAENKFEEEKVDDYHENYLKEEIKEAEKDRQINEKQHHPKNLNEFDCFEPSPNTEKDVMSCIDESIISGTSRFSSSIVTSTPACGMHVDVESFFGNSANSHKQSTNDVDGDGFPVPQIKSSSGLLQKLRRSSVVPQPSVPLPAVKEQNESKACEESLSEKLGKGLSIASTEPTEEKEEFETTGLKNRRRSELIKSGLNPWALDLQKKIMKLVRSANCMHELPELCPKLRTNKKIEVGGETFDLQEMIGQGGYAKVYRAIDETNRAVAIKYEVPSCEWEVYICEQLRHRLVKKQDDDSLNIVNLCIMQVIDAYIFSNASLLVNEYHPYGSLLECVSFLKDPNWHIICFLIVQMAKIIKAVHEIEIIHGDIKPDNFLITRMINSGWEKDGALKTENFVLKLIDCGRSIDMVTLKGQTFSGRAGTEGFDCPEMIDGRPWTYQTDFYGFAASMVVVASGKYPTLMKSDLGSYSLRVDIKRRNIMRQTIMEIVDDFLNIESCAKLPRWDNAIEKLENKWNKEFDSISWRQAASKFNEACEALGKKTL